MLLAHAAAAIEVSGLVKPIEEAEVAARDAGAVAVIEVHEGQTVAAGQLLVQLDEVQAKLEAERTKRELDVAVKRARNDAPVRFAQQSLEVARKDLERAESTIKDFPSAVSRTELDQFQLGVQRSQTAVEQARAELELAELQRLVKQAEAELAAHRVEQRKIAAPFAGVVAEIYKRRGEWATAGDRVVRLLRTDRLRVEAFVPAQSVQPDLAGRPATIETADGATLKGKIVFVSPENDPVGGQVRIWAEVDNPEGRVRPGQTVRMRLDPKPR